MVDAHQAITFTERGFRYGVRVRRLPHLTARKTCRCVLYECFSKGSDRKPIYPIFSGILSYRHDVDSPLTKREIESLTDQLLALVEQIDSGDLRATPAMRHRIEGALIGLDIVIGRSLHDTLESFRELDKRAE
jgi:hypothetical protein